MDTELMGQRKQQVFTVETKTYRDGKFLPDKIPQDVKILHHEHPAYGIGPSPVPCNHKHLITVSRQGQHIFNRESHYTNLPGLCAASTIKGI